MLSQYSIMRIFFNCFLLLCLDLRFFFAGGASQPPNVLDPEEHEALIAMFNRWGISSSLSKIQWNISGEICSGGALGDFSTYDNPTFNPGILCDCQPNNTHDSACHITRLKAIDMGLVGHIPPELEVLKFIDNVDLSKNYLTGSIPPFFGNFSAMKYVSLSFNSLSGSIPKEIGKLQNLISLGIGINNFSGPLPPEIGNITNLQKFYLDSVGATGEIPLTYSQLKRLSIMYLSDNNLVGKIPDFIGNFTNIVSLKLHGNSLQGPIPSSFENLTKLEDLRIGDLLDGDDIDEFSSLDFIFNMKSLSTLMLRNSKISGTIPSNFEEYKELYYLDLSFNSINGTLPPSLFQLNSLQYLFLGNNSLTGNLPTQISPSILAIDLSYNDLYGTLPSWARKSNQLNLVANRFIIDKSNENFLPVGLRCLQKNVPCYRGSPLYYSFRINCGGSKPVESSLSDGSHDYFEVDNRNLSSASYYMTETVRWAVSTVGYYFDTADPKYIISSSFQNKNTSDYELYESARKAPSSLRYYGLGLENGNYTVRLHFTEMEYSSNDSWKSVGRRIFDIYIQGNLKAKNFDIRKHAGGVESFVPVIMEYTTTVSNNFLEIHFFWVGKGTCCVPQSGHYGPLVSAISVTPNFKPSVSNQPPNKINRKHTSLIVGITVSILALFFISIFGFCMWKRKRRSIDGPFTGLRVKPKCFSYAELRTATEGFSPSNKLGEGGFGSVFMGKLTDGREIAVKQLSNKSSQGKKEFIAEIGLISAIQHQNLVKLYGCCYEKNNTLIVYEYLANKSLDQVLFGKNKKLHLGWSTRFEICLGMARGLAYLHEESRLRIVHRDVKASNILLDHNLKPKISDFGLARLYDYQKTHIITRVAGTIGYLAPEYAMRGVLTEKVDVFAFGIVALEILCGRKNTESSMGKENMYLLEWVWNLHAKKSYLQMIDPLLTSSSLSVSSSYDEEEVIRVIKVALLCTQVSALLRPSMSRVVAMLIGDAEINVASLSKPGYLAEWNFDDTSSIVIDSMGKHGSTSRTSTDSLS